MEVVTGAIGTLLPKLGELLKEEYNLQMSVKQGIEDLKAELESMQAALVKVSNIPRDQLDEQDKDWADEVRELSYAIEDILDSSMVRIKDLVPTKPCTVLGYIQKTICNITKLKASREIAIDIKRIESQVRKLKERHDRYKINVVVSNPATTIDPRLSTLYNKVSNLVGTDKAIYELMKMMSKFVDISERNLNTISVVGFGGLGKTTLAKALYDKLVKKFDCGAFVPVGQNPDIKKVLRDILHELDRGKYMNITSSQMDVRQLLDELKGFLRNKRYLIIIDDIWDIPTWEVIKCALVDSNSKSRVIITTRIGEVATKVGGVYNMKPLSDDNSKRLFCTRIWGSRDRSDNLSPEVSDKILRKCGGVPLCIIAIASLLVGKREEDWWKVYDCIGFGHEDNDVVKNTRKILSFSYYDLPPHLKTCLLHLSIFPEDHYISKSKLIWMWIGEGFVPCEQGLRLFDVGESYFNHLVNRSMIRLIEKSEGERCEGCLVHDIVLDLICNLSRELNFVKVVDIEPQEHERPNRSTASIHRLALHRRRAEHNPVNMAEMGHLRSFNATLCSDSRLLQLLSFKVLRVLFLNNCDFSCGACNLEHLGKLVQLRFLGLVDTRVGELPVEIGHDLKFLQTLDITGSDIKLLPPSVAEMGNLICLRAWSIRMMARIGKLTSLEHLELPFVDSCPNFLTDLTNLTEMRLLNIQFSVMDESANKALVESLRNLRRIQVLSVRSAGDKYYDDDGQWEDWTPPLEIREFSLHCICLPRCPPWIYSSYFPYLLLLDMQVVVAKEDDLRILGRLPALRYLYFHADITCLAHTAGTDEFHKLTDLATNLEVIFGPEGGALPMLQDLDCYISVGNQSVCGLVPGNMPLLQRVMYWLDCSGCGIDEVEETEIALEHAAAKVHPNRPRIDIERMHDNTPFPRTSTYYYDDNEDSDSDQEVPVTGQEYDDNEDSDSDQEVSVSTGQEYDDNDDSDSDQEISFTSQEHDDNEDSDSEEEVLVSGQEHDDNEQSDSDEKKLVTGQEYDDSEDSDSDQKVSATYQEHDDNEQSDSDEKKLVTGQEYDDSEDSDSNQKVSATYQENVKQESDMTYPVNNIKKAMSCKLLVRLEHGDSIEAARGVAYPTEEGAFIDGRPIERKNVRVTVQHVEKVFEPMKLRFHLNNKITLLGHTQGRDIQWPRKDIIVDEGPLAPLDDDAFCEKIEAPETGTPQALPSTMEASEALKLRSAQSGHEMVELPSTTEAHEISAEKKHLTRKGHQSDETLLATNTRKKKKLKKEVIH